MAAAILAEQGIEMLGRGFGDWEKLLVSLDAAGARQPWRIPEGLYLTVPPDTLPALAPALVTVADCVSILRFDPRAGDRVRLAWTRIPNHDRSTRWREEREAKAWRVIAETEHWPSHYVCRATVGVGMMDLALPRPFYRRLLRRLRRSMRSVLALEPIADDSILAPQLAAGDDRAEEEMREELEAVRRNLYGLAGALHSLDERLRQLR